MSDSEEEEEALLLDPDAIDQIARRHFGYRPCGWCVHGHKCMRNSCMSADNPNQRMYRNVEKEGGTRIEIDCAKGIMIVRVTKPHSITGKTEMTKVNVDYHTIGRAFEDPPLVFLDKVARPFKDKKPSSQVSDSSGPSTWSLTPYVEGDSPPRPNIQPGAPGSKSTWSLTPLVEGSSSTSQSGSNKPKEKEENKKKGKRRIAGPTMFGIDQEISLAAHGKMDVDKGGKEKPWRKLRIKPKFNREEEERKRDFIEKVAGTLKEKLKDGTLVGSNDDSTAVQEDSSDEDQVYGPALPGNRKAPVKLPPRKTEADEYAVRQITAELPAGTRPDRYAGRMFKVAKPVAGGSEPPPLPPTTVVADFKRRRQENEAERLARKAAKSHKKNISEFNDLMEKLPVHNEQRKINWYKF